MLLKIVLFSLGCASLALAAIGLFLPILPTTPFLILASALFLKSSTRAHRWIVGHPVFGEYISNYVERKGITARHKIASIAFLWLVILGTAIFAAKPLWLRALLPAIACAVTAHIALVRTLPSRSPEPDGSEPRADGEAPARVAKPRDSSAESSGKEAP